MCAKLIFTIFLLFAVALQSLSNASVDIKIGVCVIVCVCKNRIYVAKRAKSIMRWLFIHSLVVVILRLSQSEKIKHVVARSKDLSLCFVLIRPHVT